MIEFWQGTRRRTGRPGLAQPLVNVLGSVETGPGVLTLAWRLAQGPWRGLWHGPDGRRLASSGDFNVEIPATLLIEGANRVEVRAERVDGSSETAAVVLDHSAPQPWPLPYRVDWGNIERIGEAVQVVDGDWTLTPRGIRTSAPSYDRMVAFGDAAWRDYEVKTTATVHAHALPLAAAPTFGVAHFAIAARWPGHTEDGHRPRIQWYPLGATNEFQLRDGLAGCRWRTLTGASALCEDPERCDSVALDVPQAMRMRVRDHPHGGTVYAVKRWIEDAPEPIGWDLVTHKAPEDCASGAACLIAHNADVTFGAIEAIPL